MNSFEETTANDTEARVGAKKVMSALDYLKTHLMKGIEFENKYNRF